MRRQRATVSETDAITHAPSQMEELPDFGLKAEYDFSPSDGAVHTFIYKRRLRAPDGIGHRRSGHIKVEGGKGIPEAAEHAIARPKVIGKIIVTPQAKIGCVGLVVYVGGFLRMVADAPPYLDNREIAAFQVGAAGRLKLSVGRDTRHHKPDQVARNRYSGKQRDVFLQEPVRHVLGRTVLDAPHRPGGGCRVGGRLCRKCREQAT